MLDAKDALALARFKRRLQARQRGKDWVFESMLAFWEFNQRLALEDFLKAGKDGIPPLAALPENLSPEIERAAADMLRVAGTAIYCSAAWGMTATRAALFGEVSNQEAAAYAEQVLRHLGYSTMPWISIDAKNKIDWTARWVSADAENMLLGLNIRWDISMGGGREDA